MKILQNKPGLDWLSMSQGLQTQCRIKSIIMYMHHQFWALPTQRRHSFTVKLRSQFYWKKFNDFYLRWFSFYPTRRYPTHRSRFGADSQAALHNRRPLHQISSHYASILQLEMPWRYYPKFVCLKPTSSEWPTHADALLIRRKLLGYAKVAATDVDIRNYCIIMQNRVIWHQHPRHRSRGV